MSFPNGAATSFSARVASAVAGAAGSIEVHTGSASGPLLATVSVTSTGGWQNWQTVTATIPATTSQSSVVLKFVSSTGGDFANLNWFTFGQGTTSDPVTYPRTGWVASSNTSCGDAPANAIDGNTSTRFSTCAAMTNGQYLQVDMGRSQPVGTVSFGSSGSSSDYARGYTVSLSTDGVTWTPVKSGTGTSATISAQFTARDARYVRVTQTGTASNWWSVAEMNVQNI